MHLIFDPVMRIAVEHNGLEQNEDMLRLLADTQADSVAFVAEGSTIDAVCFSLLSTYYAELNVPIYYTHSNEFISLRQARVQLKLHPIGWLIEVGYLCP